MYTMTLALDNCNLYKECHNFASLETTEPLLETFLHTWLQCRMLRKNQEHKTVV
jgi:hypothetical protein